MKVLSRLKLLAEKHRFDERVPPPGSMPKLPQMKPKRLAGILTRLGFLLVRHKGSHAVFRHPDGRQTVIPMHPRDISPGTLRGILKDIDISVEDVKDQ
jgi:predicted RNA binding protein YcfA (HicA-like mRNA interferase family)